MKQTVVVCWLNYARTIVLAEEFADYFKIRNEIIILDTKTCSNRHTYNMILLVLSDGKVEFPFPHRYNRNELRNWAEKRGILEMFTILKNKYIQRIKLKCFSDIITSVQEKLTLSNILVGYVDLNEFIVQVQPGLIIDLCDVDVQLLSTFLRPPLCNSGRNNIYGSSLPSTMLAKPCEMLLLRNCLRLNFLGQHILQTHNMATSMLALPYKLSVYMEGDFFKRDHFVFSDDYTKLLIVQLPTNCLGGNILFSKWDPSSFFIKNKLNYVIFAREQFYEIEPVICGEMIIITFKIYENCLSNNCTPALLSNKPALNALEFSKFIPSLFRNTLVYYTDMIELINLVKKATLVEWKIVSFNTETVVLDEDENIYEVELFVNLNDLIKEPVIDLSNNKKRGILINPQSNVYLSDE